MTRLRQVNLILFAALPIALLFSRGIADAMVVVIGMSFLVVVLTQRQWAIFRHPLILPLLIAWLILNTVVSPFAIDPEASFSRSLPWLRFIAFFAAVSLWVVQTRGDIKVVVLAWGAVLLGVAADGMTQLLLGVSLSGQPIFTNRLTGPLDRPNIGIFATRIGLPLMAGWVWLLATRQNHIRYLLPAVFAFAAVMLPFVFLTGERAAALLTILALSVVVALIVVLLPRYRLHGLLALGAVGLAVAGVLLTSERILTRAQATVDVIGNIWESIYGELIRVGLEIWLENPLTGVGLKNFRVICEDIRARMSLSECHPHPHNIYVEWLSEAGLVASLGFAAFVIVFLRSVLKPLSGQHSSRIAGAFLVGATIVTLFPFTVSQSFFSNWPAILLWSSLACTAAMARITGADQGRQP